MLITSLFPRLLPSPSYVALFFRIFLSNCWAYFYNHVLVIVIFYTLSQKCSILSFLYILVVSRMWVLYFSVSKNYLSDLNPAKYSNFELFSHFLPFNFLSKTDSSTFIIFNSFILTNIISAISHYGCCAKEVTCWDCRSWESITECIPIRKCPKTIQWLSQECCVKLGKRNCLEFFDSYTSTKNQLIWLSVCLVQTGCRVTLYTISQIITPARLQYNTHLILWALKNHKCSFSFNCNKLNNSSNYLLTRQLY